MDNNFSVCTISIFNAEAKKKKKNPYLMDIYSLTIFIITQTPIYICLSAFL